MKILICLCIACVLVSCQNGPTTQSLIAQEDRVKKAEQELQREAIRLRSMRDSLQIKIDQNMALGMPTEHSETTERAMVQVQEAVFTASKTNLTHQRELLALMKAGHR